MVSDTLNIKIDSHLVERLKKEAILNGTTEEILVNEYIEDRLNDKSNKTILDELECIVDLIDRGEETDAVKMKKESYRRG